MRSPKLPQSVPKALNAADAEMLVDTVDEFAAEPWIGARDCALVSLLYGNGLRIAEALSLNRADIPTGDMAPITLPRAEADNDISSARTGDRIPPAAR